jgi:hypothetical protein
VKLEVFLHTRLYRCLESEDCLHLEMWRPREKRVPIQSGVVGVTAAKEENATLAVCVELIEHPNVTKVRAPVGVTADCRVVLFGLEGESPCRDIVPILQSGKQTFQTWVGLVLLISR